MASNPPSPSIADLITSTQGLQQSVSTLLNTMYAYIDQQVALDNGSATAAVASITQPNGQVSAQPDLGWYPLSDRSGNVSWHPCPNKLVLLAGTLKVKFIQLGYTTGYTGSNTAYTLTQNDSGWYYVFISNQGSATGITLTLQAGLPMGFGCMVCQYGTGKITFATANANDKIVNRQGFTGTGGQYAEASIKTIQRSGGVNSIYQLSGDLS